MPIQSFLEQGDVRRASFPAQELLPLYIGSGTAGGCIDGYGWMHDDFFKDARAGHNRALHYRTQKHFYRGEHAVDMIAALCHIGYAKMPRIAETSYSQILHLYTATVETSYTLTDGTQLRIRAFMHPTYPDALSFVYEYNGCAPDVMLYPEIIVEGHYGQRWNGDFSICEDGFDVRTNVCKTQVRLYTVSECGTSKRNVQADGIQLSFSEGAGKHLIVIFSDPDVAVAAKAEMTSIDAWVESAQAAWRHAYGDSYVLIPDDFVAKMTARSLYLVLSSFSEKMSSPSAPMGYTGYGWPFHFPQDISFIHPALLRLGKIEYAKRIVEYYRDTLEDMEKITHHIYGGHGVMWAWIYPLGGGTDYLHDGAPNPCYYEIHNAAYPARMAYETAMQAGDAEWTQRVALPIIRASAEFYASHLTRCESGTWDLQVTPSMSQDEFAKPNGSNYLCALYAARYCFKIAAEMGCNEYNRYLADGLSFEKLMDAERNLYRTSEDMDRAVWGQAKHPVQLNPPVFLPFGELNDAERNAYVQRAEICSATKMDFYHGWTLATFWLAASHMGDSDVLLYELHRAENPTFRDPESIAFYETTNALLAPYYVTTHGFWLQAVLDAFVCDYFGQTRIEAAVPPHWKGAEYHHLYTKDGKCHSGKVK
ncbi:MAG: hypothetical protein IJX80_03000 [Clostridia bacterium]|nr:hypothetical protein [Clostridia bacterium]